MARRIDTAMAGVSASSKTIKHRCWGGGLIYKIQPLKTSFERLSPESCLHEKGTIEQLLGVAARKATSNLEFSRKLRELEGKL